MDPFSNEPHSDFVAHPTFRDWVVDLDEDDSEFERLVGDVFDRLGWDSTVTQRSGDGGVDVHLERPGRRKVVQVKHSPKVGPRTVDRIAGAALANGATEACVVAISVTGGAKDRATEISEESHVEVEAFGTRELHRKFQRVELWDLMDEYPVEQEHAVQDALAW